MPRIALIGPGAVGGSLAAWLLKTGAHDLVLCARRPLPELVVETPDGLLTSQPVVWTAPRPDATPVDWVLITTKAYDALAAAAWFPGIVGPRTLVAVLQNGVEHRERFAALVSAEHLVPVVIDLPAERTSPTHIRQRRAGHMTVGDDANGRAFAGLFTGTPLAVNLTADWRTAAWRKLCINAAGVVSGLVLQPARVMRDDAIAETARQIIRECIAVGRAEGAVLDDALADEVVEGYRRSPGDGINSLHADRLAGRPTEIDARNGVIVRLGRKHGIPTPCNQMAVALLGALTAAAPRE
jgi:2-dehydropantoate 2-reductase